MKTMMRFAMLAGMVATAAACGQTPTAPTTEVGERRDGGFTFGGGRAEEEPDTTTAADPTQTCVTSRGGFTFGGGVVGQPDPCEEPQ
jgi:hypothetical protein